MAQILKLNKKQMAFKIQKASDGESTTISLIGRIDSERLSELKTETADLGSRVILDLCEVTLVDLEVIRFFVDCQDAGIEFIHCSPYIKEWIRRERGARKN
jgi:DNA phosphorothioation-dependent restriction protein DptG